MQKNKTKFLFSNPIYKLQIIDLHFIMTKNEV